MWHELFNFSEAPSDCDLRLSVINREGVHALVFPCRRAGDLWVHARTGRIIEVFPTHWQYWSEDANGANVQ
jgi:hypothetical protein